MIFSSPEFIFAFLPVALITFFIAKKIGGSLAVGSIVVLSCAFYGFWDVRFLPLLLGSALFNYVIARSIDRVAGESRRRIFYGFGVFVNLSAIAYFKYAGFFLENVSAIFGDEITGLHIILPLGISFFTFQNIVYIHGVWRREHSAGRFMDYASCIFFFPHLIAGPIVLYRDLIDQFEAVRAEHFPKPEYTLGLFMFITGLFKKLVIADSLAPIANSVFESQLDIPLTLLESWIGALAYTFQIYFDFSGYSDMAIGLGLLFGIRLPINFLSPYKATNIIEFWRTWHMTLSRFLREYVYFPLGGNRRGVTRRYANLLGTMLLGGLWHGAGWTFIIWGALHGVYLCFNHGWRWLVGRWCPLGAFGVMGWPITFVAVVVAWVFFRAVDVHSAVSVLEAMVSVPTAYPGNGVPFRDSHYLTQEAIGLVVLAALICVVLPNTTQWAAYDPSGPAARREWYQMRPGAVFGFACGAMAMAAIAYMTRISPFIYFQF